MAATARELMPDLGYESLDALIEARRVGRSAAAIPFSDEDARVGSVQGADGRWRMRFSPRS